MHGFIITIGFKGEVQGFQYEWKPLFDFQPEHIRRETCNNHYFAEQFTSKTFLPEKNWIDCDDFLFVNEGIIANFSNLLLAHKTDNKETLIRELVQNDVDFFKKFSGNFAGFFWDKKKNELYAFNNQTGTRKLFYYYNNDFLIVSTDLYTLSRAMDSLNQKKSHDLDAAYFLLTSGFMHEDMTLIKEVKQVRAGEFIKVTNNNFCKETYFSLDDISETNDTEDAIIEKIDDLFNMAVNEEFAIERNYPYQPVTTLSGGLDSRMVALVSHDIGYRNQTFFNFSENKYADQVIATDIAEKYKVPLLKISLSAQSLKAIDDNILVNDGLTIYTGCSQVFASLKDERLKNTGIIHTGILGDVFMGSYVSHPKIKKAKVSDGVFSKRYLNQGFQGHQKSIALYRTEELYKLYNRGYSGINTGFLYFNLIGETFSAFTHPEFVKYSYSVPRKIKFKSRYYIRWIKQKHPEYAEFIWEAIGGKPTNSQLLRLIYRAKRAFIKRMPWSSMWKNSMNPEQKWYDENPDVKIYLDKYFEQHKHLAGFNEELIKTIEKIYAEGSITEKSQVLTLLGAYKLLFT